MKEAISKRSWNFKMFVAVKPKRDFFFFPSFQSKIGRRRDEMKENGGGREGARKRCLGKRGVNLKKKKKLFYICPFLIKN